MTAVATARPRDTEVYSVISGTLASGSIGYEGAPACLNLSTGKYEPAAAKSGLRWVGYFASTVDATSADKACRVIPFDGEPTGEWFPNATSTDAVVATDVGGFCYWVDNQTVGRLGGTRSIAGQVLAVSSTKGVCVRRLVTARAQPVHVQGAALAFTSADCVVTAAQLQLGTSVKFDVPTTAANSTVTLPVTGVPDGTEVIFVADGTANGHTVTYRFGTTAVTAAATASKIHIARLVKQGSVWAGTLSVSP